MSFEVSAPGKVILFGDHSVVYNRRAIASAISLRTRLTHSHEPQDGIILDFPDIDLELRLYNLDLTTLLDDVVAEPSNSQVHGEEIDESLTKRIDHLLTRHGLQDVRLAAAHAFLYLYSKIACSTITKPDCFGHYHITSELPIGAGLGSSASVAVVIATTLLILTKEIENPMKQTSERNKGAQEKINKWAYVGEQCIHGSPSGVDNTVATYGSAVAFQKSLPIQLIPIPTLPLLLTNTGVPRSTKTQVASVADLRSNFPSIVNPMLDAMHEIAVAAQELLSTSDVDLARLGKLIVMNHGLLRSLGVSHPCIEEVINTNGQRGWTKLIGAGGGGCVLTLLDPNSIEPAAFRTSQASSGTSGMHEYAIELGGPGVGIRQGNDIHYY